MDVKEGRLSALNQSVGSSKGVFVRDGAALEILTKANVTKPGPNGYTTTTIAGTAQAVTATIAKGGTFVLNDGIANIHATFKDGAKLQSAQFDEATQQQLRQNPHQTVNIQGSGAFVNAEKAQATSPYAFFVATNQSNASTLRLTMQKQAMSNVARSTNEAAIANAIDNSTGSLYQGLLFASQAQAYNAFDGLNYDADLAAQQHNLINNLTLRQQLTQPAVINAKLNQNTRLWSNSSYNHLSTHGLSTHSYNQLLGADFNVNDTSNVGAFFGATKNTHKNDRTSKDRALHLGVYGNYALTADLNLKAGFIHTRSKDEKHLAIANKRKTHGQTEDLFAELAYSGIQSDSFALEPYAGVSYLHINTKGFTQGEIRVTDNKRDLFVTSVGLRPSIPFSLGAVSFSLQGDVAYHRFYHDKTPQGVMIINDQAQATLYGNKLTNLITAGLAIQANFTPAFSVKLGYQGAYNNDIKSNGVNAQLKYAF